MDAAPIVEIRCLSLFGESCVMGMPADHGLHVVFAPFHQFPLCSLAFIDIIRDAGGVLQSEQLKRSPQGAQQYAVQPDKTVEQVITLVPVHSKK